MIPAPLRFSSFKRKRVIRSKDNHQRKESEKFTELCAQSEGGQHLAASLTEREWPFMYAMEIEEQP